MHLMKAELMAWLGQVDWSIARHLGLSAFLSGLIGLERGARNKPAGFRTHLLVAMGSTLIMLISIHMAFLYPKSGVDPSRIASNVVAGLGFLGAGTIMRFGGNVHGLTTAASLWAVGAIGLAVGCNYYSAAIQATIAVLIALFFFDKLEHILVRPVRRAESALDRRSRRRR